MPRSPHAPAVDGALALAAAMGIGRFAYTALLPPTQRALGLDDAVAGALASALAGAALFGGTFMGITTLAMAAGRSLAPEAPGRIVATLTAVYGLGQILGPILAGWLSHRLGDPRPAVLAAAVAVGAGGVLLALPGSDRPRQG